jgi:hypothetical protein
MIYVLKRGASRGRECTNSRPSGSPVVRFGAVRLTQAAVGTPLVTSTESSDTCVRV